MKSRIDDMDWMFAESTPHEIWGQGEGCGQGAGYGAYGDIAFGAGYGHGGVLLVRERDGNVYRRGDEDFRYAQSL